MSILNNNIKRVVTEEYHDEESEILESGSGNFGDSEEVPEGSTLVGSVVTSSNMEAEKRIRREIANSNERRRMQSINAGFQSLRTLLPHHEGEKLSKAAILQQTAEYIYNLEQEKTRLLSQNCQLMRQVQAHEGGDVAPKKRKTELVVVAGHESPDEGLGSVSPDPQLVAVVSSEINELRRALERERGLRAHLEQQLRSLEQQLYGGANAIHYHEVEVKNEPVVEVEEHAELDMQLVAAESLPPVAHTQTVVCEVPAATSRSPSPVPIAIVTETQHTPRLPSALEAAIKAEPKVEVERLPSPPHGHDDVGCGRIYVNTSRQNLETIVEAIRHLEGDHLFGDEPQQEAPLALTNKPERIAWQYSSNLVQQQQQTRPGVIVVKQNS